MIMVLLLSRNNFWDDLLDRIRLRRIAGDMQGSGIVETLYLLIVAAVLLLLFMLLLPGR